MWGDCVPRSAFRVLRSAFRVPRSPFRVPRSAFRVPRLKSLKGLKSLKSWGIGCPDSYRDNLINLINQNPINQLTN